MPKKRSHNPYREKLPDGSVIEREYHIQVGKQVPYGNWKWVCYDAFREPRRKKVNLYVTAKSHAISKAKKYAAAYELGTFDPWTDPAQREVSLVQAVETFLKEKLAGGASPETVETDKYNLGRLSGSLRPNIHAGKVGTEHVESFLKGLGKPSKPASASYLRRVHASVRHFFEWAVSNGLARSNPAASISLPSAAPSQRDYITVDEYEAIMDAIEAAEKESGKSRAWLKDWIAFGFGTGLRPAEQKLLQWRAVRIEERTVRVGVGHRVKTANSARVVHVSGEALHVLERRRQTSVGRGYVFNGAKGDDPVEDRYLTKNIQRFALAAGVDKNVVRYSLRHGFGTRMIQTGTPIFELAKTMGTSVAMIEKHYGHLDPKRMAAHVERAYGDLSEGARRRQGLPP